MKRLLFRFTMLTLLLVCSCDNNQQSVPIDSLMVGKWKMVEYAGGSVNALDTISGLLEFGVMGIANGILTIYTPYV